MLTVASSPPLPPPPPPAAAVASVPVASTTATTSTPTPVPVAVSAEGPSASVSGGGMCVKDHPDYEGFFRMLKVTNVDPNIIVVQSVSCYPCPDSTQPLPYITHSTNWLYDDCIPSVVKSGGIAAVCGTGQDDRSRPRPLSARHSRRSLSYRQRQ